MNRNGPAADSPVVFRIRRESVCSECGVPLGHGSLLCLEQGRPLCLDCADLGHLEYLPRGDAALTRRARKHSGLAVVVVEFNRSRRRYERQGVLVEPEAVDRARAECLSDADLRAARRERDAVRRAELDRAHLAAFTDEVRRRFPGCPAADAARIAEHACRRHSGRVGRSAAARRLEPDTVLLAVRADARHRHTAYDELLMKGTDRADARFEVRDKVDVILDRWRESPKPDSAR